MAIDMGDMLKRGRSSHDVATQTPPVDDEAQARDEEAQARDKAYPLTIPYLEKTTNLTADSPAVRLNPEQARDGLLEIDGTETTPGRKNPFGVEAIVWEDNDLEGGMILPNNRHLKISPPAGALGFDGSSTKAFIKLPKMHQLRRVVVASMGTDLMLVHRATGSVVALETEYGQHVFMIYRVGNEIEIRRETIRSNELFLKFNITQTAVSSKAKP